MFAFARAISGKLEVIAAACCSQIECCIGGSVTVHFRISVCTRKDALKLGGLRLDCYGAAILMSSQFS